MNDLKIKAKMLWRVMRTPDDQEEITVFIPTTKVFANARVLEVLEDGFTVHWLSNYNEDWDFSSELMKFDTMATLDESEKERRNAHREAYWLIPIK